jgi:Uma2 family endonuclease
MTAELRSETMPESDLPGWVFPPPGGFTSEDLDDIPDLPAHTELIDGSLVFVSPQKDFHSVVVDLLVSALRRMAPQGLRARREMSIVLAPDQRPEPDVVVLNTTTDSEKTFYKAEDVVLAVEVVSPESLRRDRERKPQLYAQAGIPHFWRVENKDGRPVIYVYELDPATRAYVITGIHHDRLKLSLPFDIDLDLAEIDRY